MRKSLLGVLAVGLVVALGVTGCATKTYVQEQVATVGKASDAKIGEVQKQVEATQMDVTNLKKSDATQNEQIAKLSDTTKEALDRANEANKLANHSFLFEVTLTDDAVHFGFNKSDLSAEAKAALDAFAQKVKDENKNVYIEIQGNTDSIGSEQGQPRPRAGARRDGAALPQHAARVPAVAHERGLVREVQADRRQQDRRGTREEPPRDPGRPLLSQVPVQPDARPGANPGALFCAPAAPVRAGRPAVRMAAFAPWRYDGPVAFGGATVKRVMMLAGDTRPGRRGASRHGRVDRRQAAGGHWLFGEWQLRDRELRERPPGVVPPFGRRPCGDPSGERPGRGATGCGRRIRPAQPIPRRPGLHENGRARGHRRGREAHRHRGGRRGG